MFFHSWTLTRIHYSRLPAEISQKQNDQIRIMDDLRYGQLYLWVLRLTCSVIKSRNIRVLRTGFNPKISIKDIAPIIIRAICFKTTFFYSIMIRKLKNIAKKCERIFFTRIKFTRREGLYRLGLGTWW